MAREPTRIAGSVKGRGLSRAIALEAVATTPFRHSLFLFSSEQPAASESFFSIIISPILK